MSESPSAISKWLDRDFFETGAFLCSHDGKTITFAKGGSSILVDRFFPTPQPIFYLKDFYQESYLAYTPISVKEFSLEEIKAEFRPVDIGDHSPIYNDDDIYEKDFELLKSAFKFNLKKVVLVSRESYENFEGEKTIRHLIHKAFNFGVGTPYGYWNKQYGVIGSTPELLYQVQDEKLTTFALAGTAKLGLEEELLKSQKDRIEHNLVIQDIQEKLVDFTTDLAIQETKIHAYKSIVHLKTDIEGLAKPDIDFTELTNTLSPTAALGGYPKTASLQFLKNSNYGAKYPHRYFGSAFGLMKKDVKAFVVSIRNVQWEGKHLFIESGGGVVPDSVLLNEIEEIHLKRNTIRKHYL